MRKYKKSTITLLILFLIILSYQFNFIQKMTARLTASVYTSFKYNDLDFSYQKTEFSSQFGNYFISYKDKNGKVIAFEVTPKFFPVFVSFDPIDSAP
ncbi:hypothetical protein PAECIP111893_00150 [Paenibacillus plantiphilus]|uniref:DUF3139 domain-containing protein n=1 Tax=Paenibacillus plantiphilus TaxID=2905650 RepID=A0ABM9BNG0_9BACL|nr:hypothetical protein PAECIP111893_00150 [Paenibacillus plantiphilus]